MAEKLLFGAQDALNGGGKTFGIVNVRDMRPAFVDMDVIFRNTRDSRCLAYMIGDPEKLVPFRSQDTYLDAMIVLQPLQSVADLRVTDAVDFPHRTDRRTEQKCIRIAIGLRPTVQMILTAVKIATPAQKANAQKRMQGWIDDFNVLATQPQT